MRSSHLRLYVATDRECLGRRDLKEIVAACVENGATMVQLREKQISTRDFCLYAQQIHAITRRHDVPLIINDRVDVMLAVEAEGVHVGREDLPLPLTRQLAGDRIVGYSVNTLEHLRYAEEEGADYVGIGPVHPTGTKTDTGPAVGMEGLRTIARHARIPAVAIGGITAENAAEAIKAGAAGCCVVSAILKAHDVAAGVLRLRSVIDDALSGV